jgi:hypothetical protein
MAIDCNAHEALIKTLDLFSIDKNFSLVSLANQAFVSSTDKDVSSKRFLFFFLIIRFVHLRKYVDCFLYKEEKNSTQWVSFYEHNNISQPRVSLFFYACFCNLKLKSSFYKIKNIFILIKIFINWFKYSR